MIKNINITGIKMELDDTTKKYVYKKIGQLDRYMPRHARKSAKVDVKLSEINQKNGNKYEAEVIIQVPDEVLTAKDSTVNVLAAIDIVETKMATQLRKYHQKYVAHEGKRGILARFKRSFSREV